MVQGAMSTAYGGGWVGGGLQLPFRHKGTGYVPKKMSYNPQTTLQGEAGVW